MRGGVKAFPIEATDRVTLHTAINSNVNPGATIYSDCHSGYVDLIGYHHHAVRHSVGEYVRNQAHTNGIESFWALLKRGYYGIHHHMSEKHLHRYVNEFAYRHDMSQLNTIECISGTIQGMIGFRLAYKDLTA